MSKKSHGLMLVIAVCFISTACGRITITGKAKGSGNDDATEVKMIRGDLDSYGTMRLRALAGQPEASIWRDPAFQLRVDVTGNPDDLHETYHFLVAVQGEGDFVEGTSNDRKFVVNNVGKLVHLKGRKGDEPVFATVNGRHHIGTTFIAIQKDDDRVVPWRITASGNGCLPLDGDDCFDMETLTLTLFEEISNKVNRTVRDNVVGGSVADHALHFVPQVTHKGHEDAGRRARGFGFVYEAKIETPIGAVKVLVPISILFLSNVQTYLIDIDPLSFDGGTPASENLDRIYVNDLPSPNLIFTLEGLIRDIIVDGIREAEEPELIEGISFSEALLTGFNTAAGPVPLSGTPPRVYPSYEVILLPETTNTVVSTKVWSRSGDGDIEEEQRVRLVFIE